MKPILILPIGAMSAEDIERLRQNDICAVEAESPGLVRFVDPPPTGNHDQVTEACLQLSRLVMNNPSENYTGRSLSAWWAQCLINAHPLRRNEVERVTASRRTVTKQKSSK